MGDSRAVIILVVSILILGAVGFSQMSTPTYAAHIDPLQGIYQLDEKTGTTAIDGVGHIGNADLVNMDVSAARILGGTEAAFSGALELNAGDTNDRVRINPVGAGFPTTAITVEFWIKTTDDHFAVPVSYASGAGSINEFIIEGVDEPRFWIKGSATDFATGKSFNDGSWHHVAVTWDSDCAGAPDGHVRLYIDGVLEFTSSSAKSCSGSLTAAGSLVFGQEQDAVDGVFQTFQACSCTMDEIRIWNEALDAEAIAESFNLGEARNNADYDTELNHDSFASVIVWTSAFHDAESDIVSFRMMRVNTDAEIDPTGIDCERKNPKKIDCPGETDTDDDGILFRGLSPKGTSLTLFDPDENTILACDLAACDATAEVEVDIDVGDFTNPRANRPATAHFQVVLDIDEELGSNVHRH